MKTRTAVFVCMMFLIPGPPSDAQDGAGTDRRTPIFASDFGGLDDGDFPPDLVFKGGGMQIDSSRGDAMLRFEGGSWFHVPLPETLPDAFAIEFDYYTTEDYAVLFVAPFDSSVSGSQPPSYSGYRQGEFSYFSLANTSVGVAIDTSSNELPRANARNSAFTDGVVPVRLEVRGSQAKVFIQAQQVVVNPAARILRTDTVEFFYASMGAPGNGYLGDIRIAPL